MIKRFVNTSNGILWIPELVEKEYNFEFIRIQSTTIEKKDYLGLLMGLDNNLLMNLALGETCLILDAGARRQVSKTIYTAIPFIRHTLRKLWLNQEEDEYRIARNGDDTLDKLNTYFNKVYDSLFKFNNTPEKNKMKRKLKYYLHYNPTKVDLMGLSKSTEHDGDFNHFNKILNEPKMGAISRY